MAGVRQRECPSKCIRRELGNDNARLSAYGGEKESKICQNYKYLEEKEAKLQAPRFVGVGGKDTAPTRITTCIVLDCLRPRDGCKRWSGPGSSDCVRDFRILRDLGVTAVDNRSPEKDSEILTDIPLGPGSLGVDPEDCMPSDPFFSPTWQIPMQFHLDTANN
eukprot:gb/GEZN01019919.1/.p1 GENE.gb/GEZN01019919.1/~~gb/GEZN01019919.1/.p1  ORF type:complete len:163 (-),score=4.70 gb/GEZN01019919.1/:52-540(-)